MRAATDEADALGRLPRLAAGLGLSLAVSLVVLKLAAALVSDSLAILSSLIDSMADIFGSGITFLAVRISQQPPDRSHRFGHGKVESLSALGQACIVSASAVFILIDGIGRLGAPPPLDIGVFPIAVMGFAILATAALVTFQSHVVRRTDSQAIAADRLHFTADLATNAAVLLSLAAAVILDVRWLDPVVALLIALYLLYHAFRIGRRAIDVLMDRELPQHERARIEAIVRAHPEVHDLHDLRTRRAAGTIFIELHAELDGGMTLRQAHHITDAIERELGQAFDNAEVIIHQEPAGLEDDRLDHRIAETEETRS